MSSKLREALDKIGNISAYVAENCNNADTAKYMNDIISIVQHALAEPLRNCDVGTAEEQAERFDAYCDSHTNCAHCPLAGQQCALAWSQMPYEEEK
jgi:hypothetical protein